MMRQLMSCPTSFSKSAASFAPLREAGMNARELTSTVTPPFTTPVTRPLIVDLSANAFSSALQSFGPLKMDQAKG